MTASFQQSGKAILHVLGVRGSGILLVGGDVDLVTGTDGVVLVTNSVAGSDLGTFLRSVSIVDHCSFSELTYGVKSDGKGTARLGLLGLTSVVNDGLVVLVRSVGEVHADHVKAGFTLVSRCF